MAQAQIKITNIQDGKINVVVDEKTEVQIKDNKYYFTVSGFSQELLIENNTVEIIRPEMKIKLFLNEIIESIYTAHDQQIKMKFKMNKLKRKNNDLEFTYSLISTNNEEVNTIEVSIKF